jgi:hypothetical protein
MCRVSGLPFSGLDLELFVVVRFSSKWLGLVVTAVIQLGWQLEGPNTVTICK